MDLIFKELTADDAEIMIPFYTMRSNRTCDSVFLESFIWKDMYHVRYAVWEGRYEYRRLDCSDKERVWKFLDLWREKKGEDAEHHLDYEVTGIHSILHNCSRLPIHMGGIFLDGTLKAFSIGSENPLECMAVIHIEKADPEIPGLYQAMNQQFLIHEFPDAEWVNREDDMGIPGLRKAKLSYQPTDFARKYLVRQKEAGGYSDGTQEREE